MGTRSGKAHWWAQRTTSIALVPLSLWLTVGLVRHTGASHAAVVAWLHSPWAAILMILTLGTAFYHAMLGLEVVIEDYVHGPARRLASMLAVRFACVVFVVTGVFAVLRIALSP
ncbi:MAG: succinate dehydrogenase, hydrophobic membrane anchor protein [Alphaproteobacteria bacterium]